MNLTSTHLDILERDHQLYHGLSYNHGQFILDANKGRFTSANLSDCENLIYVKSYLFGGLGTQESPLHLDKINCKLSGDVDIKLVKSDANLLDQENFYVGILFQKLTDYFAERLNYLPESIIAYYTTLENKLLFANIRHRVIRNTLLYTTDLIDATNEG